MNQIQYGNVSKILVILQQGLSRHAHVEQEKMVKKALLLIEMERDLERMREQCQESVVVDQIQIDEDKFGLSLVSALTHPVFFARGVAKSYLG